MAKIRKFKLAWNPSDSDTVAGYKLYWSEGPTIGYDSQFIDVGNVTEIDLPDGVTLPAGPVLFGVTAIDKDGNESDMAMLTKPFQLHIPQAPVRLSLTYTEDFKVLAPQITTESAQEETGEDPLADAIESREARKPVKIKYYDDVGYRKFRSE